MYSLPGLPTQDAAVCRKPPDLSSCTSNVLICSGKGAGRGGSSRWAPKNIASKRKTFLKQTSRLRPQAQTPQGANAGKPLGANLRGTTVPAFTLHDDGAVWIDSANIKHALVRGIFFLAVIYSPPQGPSATPTAPGTAGSSDSHPSSSSHGPVPTTAKRRHHSSSTSTLVSRTQHCCSLSLH